MFKEKVSLLEVMEKLDKIFYINLRKRTDRKEQIEDELFEKLQLPREMVERFPGNEHKRGSAGCALAHVGVLKKIKELGFKNTLILEDDFQSVRSRKFMDDNVDWLLKNHPEYDICMISYNMHNDPVIEIDKYIRKALNAQTTSGYIINSKYVDKLLECFEKCAHHLCLNHKEQEWAIDVGWKKLQEENPNFIAFKYRFGIQRDGFSDVRKFKCRYGC